MSVTAHSVPLIAHSAGSVTVHPAGLLLPTVPVTAHSEGVTVHSAGLLLRVLCQLLSILRVYYCPFGGSVTAHAADVTSHSAGLFVHTAGLLLSILFGHVVLIPVTLVP